MTNPMANLEDHVRIFELSGFDVFPLIENNLIDSYKSLYTPQNNSEKLLIGEIQKMASGGDFSHSQMSHALLYSILTEPEKAEKTFEMLSFSVRDSFAEILSILHILIVESSFSKLTELTKRQLVWLISRLTSLGVPNLEYFFVFLLKEIRSGDLSDINLKYTNGILDILIANRAWLDKHDRLLSLSCYTFLRILREHKAHKMLLEKETKFCLSLLNEKFDVCMIIGRDLVRVLQGVSRIPDFRNFWSVLLEEPRSLHPDFQGLVSLLKTPTNPYFLQFQLPLDITKKLDFLMNNVENEQIEFYYELFREEHLSTIESLVLIPDIIRYICAIIHPSNDILGSNIATRWRVIRFFFKDMNNPIAAADSKLALFYDWLFFDSNVDSIMNIEPGILLIMNSLESQSYVSECLIEFLFFVRQDYFPDFHSEICRGIDSAMAYLLEKGVFRSIEPVFALDIDQLVKAKMHEMFQRFLPNSINAIPNIPNLLPNASPTDDDPMMLYQPNNSHPVPSMEDDEYIVPNFSPTEDSDLAPLNPPHEEPHYDDNDSHEMDQDHSHNEPNQPSELDDGELTSFPEFGDLFLNLKNVIPLWNLDDRHILDSILQIFVDNRVNSGKIVSLLTKIFNHIPSYYLDFFYIPKKFIGQLIPRSTFLDNLAQGDSEPSDFSGFESASELEVPFVSLFDKVWESFYHNGGLGIKLFHESNQSKELIQLLVKLASSNDCVGPFWFLYTLRAFSSEYPDMREPSIDSTCCYDMTSPHPFKAYAQFVFLLSKEKNTTPQDIIISDMIVFLKLEKTVLYGILPAIFRFLPLWCVNNVQLIKLIVEGMDSIQLTHTISRIYKRMLHMLDTQGIDTVISQSFSWEPESLFNLWVIIVAEFGGDPQSTEVVLRSFIRHYAGDGFGETSDSGGILVKLSDLLQKVPPTIGLLQSLFVGCHNSTNVKKLGPWFVMMLSQWAQMWSSLLHYNLPVLLTHILNSDFSALRWKGSPEQSADGEQDSYNSQLEQFTDDVIQWLRILHCWCDPKSFSGTPVSKQGQSILLGNPTSVNALETLITNHSHKGLNFDQFPFFSSDHEAPSTYAAEACYIGNQYQDVTVGCDDEMDDASQTLKRQRC